MSLLVLGLLLSLFVRISSETAHHHSSPHHGDVASDALEYEYDTSSAGLRRRAIDFIARVRAEKEEGSTGNTGNLMHPDFDEGVSSRSPSHEDKTSFSSSNALMRRADVALLPSGSITRELPYFLAAASEPL